MQDQPQPSRTFRFFYHFTKDFPVVLWLIPSIILGGQVYRGDKPDFSALCIIATGACGALLGLHGLCFGKWNIRRQQLEAEDFARRFPTYYEDLARRAPWRYWLFYAYPLPRPVPVVLTAGLILFLMGGFFFIVGAVRWWNGTA